MTIQQFKINSIKELQTVTPSPQLDVTVLLEHILNYSKTDLLLKNNEEIPVEKLNWLEDAISRRKKGLPVAYITGIKEFYGYTFHVTPAVLIPKPDTEILVENAISLIVEKMQAQPNRLLTICDMCTGSGCIGISVLRSLIDQHHIPQDRLPKFTLVDISEDALNIARKNMTLGTGPSVSKFIRSNLFEQVPGHFDFILTNPPYIPSSMVDELLKDGRSEPRLALDGDINTLDGSKGFHTDGLDIIRNLIPEAKEHLAPRGRILMETGEYNAKAAASIAKSYGLKTKIIKDLEGQDRVVEMK